MKMHGCVVFKLVKALRGPTLEYYNSLPAEIYSQFLPYVLCLKETVDETMSLMRRFHGHETALAVERRVQTLALEEVDTVAPQVNSVQEERSSSLDVAELNDNIEI